MLLQQGDIISTGTPPGVGMGTKPPCYLKAGDVVEMGIEASARRSRTCVQIFNAPNRSLIALGNP